MPEVGDFEVEYAKSGRAKCKGCKQQIEQGAVRLAIYSASPFHDGVIPNWHHMKCFFGKRKIPDTALIRGFLNLKPVDQDEIAAKCGNASGAAAAASKKAKSTSSASQSSKNSVSEVDGSDWTIEYAKSSRSTCQSCSAKIEKDVVRVGIMEQAEDFDGTIPRWHHLACLSQREVFPDMKFVAGFTSLRNEDQKEVLKLAGQETNGKKRKLDKGNDDAEQSAESNDYSSLTVPALKKLCKERSLPVSGSKSVIIQRLLDADSPSTQDEPSTKDADAMDTESADSSTDLAAKYAEQLKVESQLRWEIKDKLNGLTTGQLKNWLDSNSLPSNGGRDHLLDLISEGIMYGAIPPCEKCSQHTVRYKDGMYKCCGQTEWSSCAFACESVEYEEWVIPEDIEEDIYGIPLFKKLQKKKSVKPLEAHRHHAQKAHKLVEEKEKAKQGADARLEKIREEKNLEFKKTHLFSGINLAFHGKSCDEARREFKNRAGQVIDIDDETIPCDALITDAKGANSRAKVVKTVRDEDIIPIVSPDFILDAVKSTDLPDDLTSYVLHGDASELKDKVAKIKTRTIATKSGSSAQGRNGSGSGGSIGSRSGKSGPIKVKVKGVGVVHEDSGLVDTGHIYCSGKDVYSATLSKTDISHNANSYYILQLIELDDKSGYSVFRKWGRVGTTVGGTKINDYKSVAYAKHEFHALFLEKSGNEWSDHFNFVKKPGLMNLVDNEWTDESDSLPAQISVSTKSKHHPRIVELIQALFDVNVMKQQLMEMEIDTEKMPLGRLSKAHIQKGYIALTDIQRTLALPDSDSTKRHSLLAQSNQFYTLIPHDFGRERPTIIDSTDLLKQKLEIVDALLQMEIATSILQKDEKANTEEDPIDAHYRKLMTVIEPIDNKSTTFDTMNTYLQKTHASTHGHYSLELLDLFSMDRSNEGNRFTPFSTDGNRKLLWHGSRRTNFVGIISQGLRIAPPEAPATGYMFGKGVYFADSSSKSANYCFTSRDNNVGFMLLCEVALGKEYELNGAQYMDKTPAGYLSTKGCGKSFPDPAEYVKLEDGCVIPSGKLKTTNLATTLLYNEFIVYDVSQIRMRYLLKVKFNYK